MVNASMIKVRVKARTFSYKRARYKQGQELFVAATALFTFADQLEAVTEDGTHDSGERPRTLTRRVK